MPALPVVLAFFAAVAVQPAGAAPAAQAAAAPAAPAPAKSAVDTAADLIGAGKPAEAVALLDPLIADQDRRLQGDAREVFCSRGPAESRLYDAQAARDRRQALILGEDSCYALFLKGFALIDLNRSDEAKAWLDRAAAMAPSNAHFLGELAEWYKTRKDWKTARALFQRAVDASQVSPDPRKVFDRTRGLRGLAFILIEEGRLDEAEALYRQCLQLDPNDDRSKHQLQYIADKRGKKI
jgi:tetratricopeptide (TPR) repeat protein